MQPTLVWAGGREVDLRQLQLPLPIDDLAPGDGAWEVELGFGKGRYVLRRAREARGERLLGVEIAAPYYRLARDRAARRGLHNLVLVRGEAVYLMATSLPTTFADAVHVYFPDPWPKDRHRKRRLFDSETVDLVLGLLRPGGELCFATDFLEYGEFVGSLLAAHPAMEVEVVEGAWPEGPRTNYEAKFVAAGRPVVRLVATRRSAPAADLLHPAGRPGVLSAPRVER
jgi:tRNA (guanine-N7-)-methyltransferase